MLFVYFSRAAANVARGDFFVVAVALSGRFHVHYYALYARRDDERRILYVRRLFAEYRAQQLFFRSEFRFRFWCDFADENVARLDLGAHADYAVAVEIFEGFVADIGNVACDFFGPELCVAGSDFVLLDMNGRKDVIFNQFFGEQNSVFKVVSVPRHEGDKNVFAECEFTVFSSRAVRQNRADLYSLAALDDRLLGKACAGVGAHKLTEFIYIYAFVGVVFDFTLDFFRHFAVGSDDYALCIDARDLASRFGKHHRAGVCRNAPFNARSNERSFGFEERHALALHVRAHQRAVGVVVFEERNDACRNRYELLGADVHVVDFRRINFKDFVKFSRSDAADELAVFNFGIGLRDCKAFFVVGGQIIYLVEDFSLFDFSVRGFNEAEFVYARIA